MDMETVSNQLLSRYSFDRSPKSPDESSPHDKHIDEQKAGHRAHHVQRHEAGHGVEQRRDIDNKADKHARLDGDGGEAGGLTYRRSERTSLLVRTQEGDTVRLRIKASESLTVAVDQSDEDGETVAAIEMEARSHTRITIKVKGDLNEQEMAAIQSVIDQAGTMAEDFFAGDTEGAFATASALEIDATQLANIRIRMKSSEQLTYPMSTALPSLVRGPETAAGEPAAGDPVADNPVTATVATTDGQETVPVAAGATDETGDGDAAGSDTPATEGVAVVEESTTPDRNQVMASALQSIGVFLNNMLSAFGGSNEAPGNSLSSPDMTLKLQVFRSMLLSISDLEKPESEEPAAALAADTIDAVTAQQTPLDAVA